MPGMSESALAASARSSSGVRARARIVPGCRDAAAERFAEALEAEDVVALPAVERDRHLGERSERGAGVDALIGILLTGERVGGFDPICGHATASRTAE